MSSFNRVILMGNITRDVELRAAGSSTVGNFGLATNRKYRTNAGEDREEVMFIDCEAWGKTAEVIAQYHQKGSKIHIEGRLKLDQWDDKNGGGKRSKISVLVDSFQFVGGKNESSSAGGGGGAYQRSDNGGGGSPQQINHDDIPFSPNTAWA